MIERADQEILPVAAMQNVVFIDGGAVTGHRGMTKYFVSAILLVGTTAYSAQFQSRREQALRPRHEKAQRLEPERVSPWEERIRRWEDQQFPFNIFVKGWRGLHPVVGGMPSGSGTVFGVGYVQGLEAQYMQFETHARYSTRGYAILDAEIAIPPPQSADWLQFGLATEYRNLTSLRFYGLGNDSDLENRSTYLLSDYGVRARLSFASNLPISFRAETGVLFAETGPGDDDEPSLGTLFSPDSVEGFDSARTRFGVVGGSVDVNLLDDWEEPAAGVSSRFSSERYEDTDLNAFDFTRWVADVKLYVPLGYRSRMLALRVRTSHSMADAGHGVPFYLMETLGGAQTIRGFREFRFRDTRNLLVQAEYRWEVWTHVNFSLFFDAGKVFSEMADLSFAGMHTGYGFGIRAHAPGGTTFRIDLARSAEGYRLHIGGGPSF